MSENFYRITCRVSSVSTATDYRLDGWGIGVRGPIGSRFFFSSPRRPDRFRGPFSLLSNGYGDSFPGVKAAGAWNYTQLVPGSRISESIHPLLLTSSWSSGGNFTFLHAVIGFWEILWPMISRENIFAPVAGSKNWKRFYPLNLECFMEFWERIRLQLVSKDSTASTETNSTSSYAGFSALQGQLRSLFTFSCPPGSNVTDMVRRRENMSEIGSVKNTRRYWAAFQCSEECT
jgi:hypothetical protein